MIKVGFDYGHGGTDPGASGNGMQEKNEVLAIGLRSGKILERHGIKVVHSRTNDKTLSLKQRTDLFNKEKVDIIVSFHTNSFDIITVNGVETFSYPGSKNGAKLAKLIQDELVATKLFKSNRGHKTANFHMLRESNMPSALTELGFISNAEDAKVIKNKKDELALAVAKGVLRYFNIKYKEEVKKPSTPKPPASNKVDGYYRVVTGSYQDKKLAEIQIEKLKKAGFDSFLAYYEK